MTPDQLRKRAAELAAMILDEPAHSRAEWRDTKLILLAVAGGQVFEIDAGGGTLEHAYIDQDGGGVLVIGGGDG